MLGRIYLTLNKMKVKILLILTFRTKSFEKSLKIFSTLLHTNLYIIERLQFQVSILKTEPSISSSLNNELATNEYTFFRNESQGKN